jgi:16S rRNA (uracil1498-N3)-methyltransferase
VVAALHESGVGAFTELPWRTAAAITLIVGPEGGLDDAELSALSAAGAEVVRLGPTVLRTSTAAAVALGALGALTTRW